MKCLNIILLLTLSIEAQSAWAAPLFSRMQLGNVIQTDAEKNIAKRIKKTHLQYLRLLNGCELTHSLYVGLKPSRGPFSGHDMEMVIMDGKIFRRFRLCDGCPFSPWHYIDDYPYTDKLHKQHGFLVCPDGSIQLPSGSE